MSWTNLASTQESIEMHSAKHGRGEQKTIKALEKCFISSIKKYPQFYDNSLMKRNANWIPRIEAFLKTSEIEFVLVGVAHNRL